jgi:hypothetical protein
MPTLSPTPTPDAAAEPAVTVRPRVAAGNGAGLPAVVTPLSRGEILKRLETASRRGRLPGFRAGEGEECFIVAAHGHPFDADLIARCGQVEGGAEGGGTRLTFETRMHRRLPAVFVVILVATVWPGVHFMDGLIPAAWGWIPTWWWYVPVTALPLPWVWAGLMKKSRASIGAAAEEAVKGIAGEVAGRLET